MIRFEILKPRQGPPQCQYLFDFVEWGGQRTNDLAELAVSMPTAPAPPSAAGDAIACHSRDCGFVSHVLDQEAEH